MHRIGKLPNGGRYILLASYEEILELKAKGFTISDSIPIKDTMFGFGKNNENNEDGEPEHHSSKLWQLCEQFFDIQINRDPRPLKFFDLKKINNIIKQEKKLSIAQKNIYEKELARKNMILENWFTILKQICGLGYDEDYIIKVINFAINDFATKEQLSKNPGWPGWGSLILSLNTLLKVSANNLTRWENLVSSYENKNKEQANWKDDKEQFEL